MNQNPGKYTVFVDDKYHYQDESERYRLGSFDTLDAAVGACKGVVDRWLKDTHNPEMSASELCAKYTMFGEDPFIVCTPRMAHQTTEPSEATDDSQE